MDRESPELIEHEMERTRESLTAKVSMLEDKVLGQIESATDTVQGTMTSVQETVHSVKSAVQETVESVSGTVRDSVQSLAAGVKETLDMHKQVEQHPWPMVGGATVLGFITALMVFRPQTSGRHSVAFSAAPSAPTHRPQWLSDILEMAGAEVKKLAQQAIAQASASLRQTVETRMPELIEHVVPGNSSSRSAPEYTNGMHC